MGAALPSLLVGRDAELERLVSFVSSLPDGAAALLIRGGAGIGKTTLWREAVRQAEGCGVRVLCSRCAELEMPIAFGALADLLDGVFDETTGRLVPAQRHALAAALGRGIADGRPDWVVLAAAVLASLRTLAARSPLLVAVDDLQWLDAGSRRTLAWALRRVGDAPIGLLATVRGRAGEEDLLALADVLPQGRFCSLEVGPMSSGALQHLVAARVGTFLPRPTLARVRRASGGNPLFALEFARALAEDTRPGRPGPLEVPVSLEELVRARAAALPRRLRPVLELVAVLGQPTLPRLERALDDSATVELVEDAARAEVLSVDDDGTVRFCHPLVAAAVYFGVADERRRRLHRRLADTADAADERGRHAALGAQGPDPRTAALVEEGAAAAAGRGALDAAAELAGEAARLTPSADADARRRRLLLAAGALVQSGEFAAARGPLDALLAEDAPPAVRADALLLRAECEMRSRGALVGLLRQACEVAADPRQRWQALIRLAQHEGWVSGDLPVAVERAREALEVARAAGDGQLLAASRAPLAFYEAARGRSAQLPQDGAEYPPGLPWWHVAPAVALGCHLMWRGELEPARDALVREVERQDDAGREAAAGFVRCWLSELEWRAGNWERADTLAHEATERLGDVNPTAFPRALGTAAAGRAQETRAIADGALEWARANDEAVAPPRFLWLLGLLALGRGEAERARDVLTEAQDRLDAAGIHEPGYLPVLPDLAESLVAAGKLDAAEQVVVRLEAAGAGHRWAHPAAQRARAVLLLACRDDAAGPLADRAAAAFAENGHLFDRARALLVAGNARRRIGERRQAAIVLAEAAEILARLGANTWLEQAEDALRRARPRPQRDGHSLTAAETRVAQLVAAGRKNKEVAAELYTTVATVEAHLTRIYRKLGIRSRSELARIAAERTLDQTKQ